MESYAARFEKHQFTRMSDLFELTSEFGTHHCDSIFLDLGIVSWGHRLRLLHEVKALQKKAAAEALESKF